MERLCTLNTENLLKLVECLEVVQGHTFWDQWKADEGLRITV